VAQPRLTPERALESFSEVSLGYSREEAMAEARRGAGADLAGAASACPFGVDIPRLVALSAEGRFDEAHAAVLEAHPWPGILGRWCQKPCERAHALGEGRESLAIGAIERAAADHGAAGRPPFRPGPPSGRRVAILGAGSAASAAAYRLRGFGHAVTMIEQLPAGGGMMVAGFPEFRLPFGVVERENALREWGAELRLGTRLTREMVAGLLSEFDAVVAGTGKFREARLDVPGETLDGVLDALDFLKRVRFGEPVAIGRRVAVLGAGNTARDVSRAVRRLGGEVTIYYRRRQEDMPVNKAAIPRYMAQQREEGIAYRFEAAPLRVIGEGGRVAGMEFVATEAGPPDASGRPAPLAIPGSEFTVECDTVIAATGESADLSFLPEGIRVTASGNVWIDPETFETSVPRLYAVGAMAGADTTSAAFASGFACADVLDRRLRKG
jgi:NADPH-dependent glutamate synthase beta subunit-like oxidoreductase